MIVNSQKVRMVGLCVAGALLASASVARADDQELQERIKQLENRITELESKNAQATSVPSAEMPQKTLDFLGQTELSGYVAVSFFHAFNDCNCDNLGFVTHNDEFMINKFKLVLENPIDASGDKWDAGFRADLIFGQDAN